MPASAPAAVVPVRPPADSSMVWPILGGLAAGAVVLGLVMAIERRRRTVAV